jgi:hypothetical protein
MRIAETPEYYRVLYSAPLGEGETERRVYRREFSERRIETLTLKR